ncbi:MAG: hypothetical protein ACRENE_27900 [Polyangiaceae bacterium]
MLVARTFLVSAGLTVVSAAVAACSGATSGGSGPSAMQASADIASALCNRIDACAPIYIQSAYRDLASCISRETPLFAQALSAPGTGWTPAAIESCAKAFPGTSCDDVLAHSSPSACKPPAGQLATGAACGDDGQCASGYCNLGAGGKCGSCAAAAGAAGATCYRDGDCVDGTVCVGVALSLSPPTAGKCTALGTSGAKCDASTPCAKSLACSDASSGTCGAVVAGGASCSQTVDIFGTCGAISGSYCGAKTNGTCTKLGFAAAAQPCGLIGGALTTCEGSGVCQITAGTSMGTCVAPAADFGNCDAKNGPGCLAPAVCIGGACVVATPDSCK